MEQLILIALAIAAITVTIGRTHIFKPLRDNVPTKWLKKLSHCPYCLSHYFSFFVILFVIPYSNLLDLIIKTMATVAVSSIIALFILRYLNLLEKE